MNPGRVVCSARDSTSEADDLVPTAPSQQSNNRQHVFSGSQLPVSCHRKSVDSGTGIPADVHKPRHWKWIRMSATQPDHKNRL